MANNRKMTKCRRKQIIWSEPRKVFVEKYLTKTGKKQLALAKTKKEKDAVWAKYGKNRYRINKNAKIIKIITHIV